MRNAIVFYYHLVGEFRIRFWDRLVEKMHIQLGDPLWEASTKAEGKGEWSVFRYYAVFHGCWIFWYWGLKGSGEMLAVGAWSDQEYVDGGTDRYVVTQTRYFSVPSSGSHFTAKQEVCGELQYFVGCYCCLVDFPGEITSCSRWTHCCIFSVCDIRRAFTQHTAFNLKVCVQC